MLYQMYDHQNSNFVQHVFETESNCLKEMNVYKSVDRHLKRISI